RQRCVLVVRWSPSSFAQADHQFYRVLPETEGVTCLRVARRSLERALDGAWRECRSPIPEQAAVTSCESTPRMRLRVHPRTARRGISLLELRGPNRHRPRQTKPFQVGIDA